MKEVVSMVMENEIDQNEDQNGAEKDKVQPSFIKTGRKGARKNKNDTPSKKDAESALRTP